MITINGKKTIAGCCIVVIAQQLALISVNPVFGLFILGAKVLGQSLTVVGVVHKIYKLIKPRKDVN